MTFALSSTTTRFPEPIGLDYHATALQSLGAEASDGFVRGPKGIRFQSRHESIDAQGRTKPDAVRETVAPYISDVTHGRAVKLVGTDMAIRRDTLLAIRGFDPVFRYYLEDSDLSWRLGQDGKRVSVASLEEVHHNIAASARWARRGVPRTLVDVGRGSALFIRKHSSVDQAIARDATGAHEKQKLLRFIIRGCANRETSDES